MSEKTELSAVSETEPTTPTMEELRRLLNAIAGEIREQKAGYVQLWGVDEAALRWLSSSLPEMRRQLAAHEEIFAWLLGERGEFPESVPGKRYGFRSELRKRLAASRVPLSDPSAHGEDR